MSSSLIHPNPWLNLLRKKYKWKTIALLVAISGNIYEDGNKGAFLCRQIATHGFVMSKVFMGCFGEINPETSPSWRRVRRSF